MTTRPQRPSLRGWTQEPGNAFADVYEENVVHMTRWPLPRATRDAEIATAALREHDRRHPADAALIEALKSNILFELQRAVEKRHSPDAGDETDDAKALVNKLVIEIGTVVLLALDKPKKRPSAEKKCRRGRKPRKPAAM